MATNFRVKIGKIGSFNFLCRRGIPKWIGISQLQFRKVHWQLFLYNVCNFGEI